MYKRQHADIEDKAQTVTVKHPFITTSALDGIDGDKDVVVDDVTTVLDTVEYRHLCLLYTSSRPAPATRSPPRPSTGPSSTSRASTTSPLSWAA